MNKLRMNLDDLRVESFATGPKTSDRRGTVRAHAIDSSKCLPSQVCGSAYCESGGCTFMCSDNCTFTADYQCMDTANAGCV